jgi:hypothetical protein
MEGISFNGLHIGSPARAAPATQPVPDASRAGKASPRPPESVEFVEFVVASDARSVEPRTGPEVRR